MPYLVLVILFFHCWNNSRSLLFRIVSARINYWILVHYVQCMNSWIISFVWNMCPSHIWVVKITSYLDISFWSLYKNMQKIRFLLKWTNIYICNSCIGSFYCHSWWTFGIAPQLATPVLFIIWSQQYFLLSLVTNYY